MNKLHFRDDKRVYNLREKAFAKILSRALDHPEVTKDAILVDFEMGDMGLTAKKVCIHISINNVKKVFGEE